jgi:hypothetical protein
VLDSPALGQLEQAFQLFTTNLWGVECAWYSPNENLTHMHFAQLRWMIQFDELCFGGKKNGPLGDSLAVGHIPQSDDTVEVAPFGYLGYKQLGAIKPTTIHQEFRVLRRMLNVAVCKKLLAANPCSGVEFPVAVKGLFRPHYVMWSEQQRIESHGPQYLPNVIRIITSRPGCGSTRN